MVNAIYFSDGTGVKKANIIDLAGESQSIVSTILSFPAIPSNNVGPIHGEMIGDFFLTLPYNDGNGCVVVKNETTTNQFLAGQNVLFAKINNRGILYCVRDNNTIEVYYGANTRSGTRAPDFIYSSSSTPALISGNITAFNLSNDASTELINGTRLYVGTSNGAVVIDCKDAEASAGYSAGLDNIGSARTYRIASGIGTYKVIGGTSSSVSAISSNEDAMMMFVATSQGLSQISLNDNKRTIFMTAENNLIPSNTIRDVFGYK
jgi:hypothetical protein